MLLAILVAGFAVRVLNMTVWQPTYTPPTVGADVGLSHPDRYVLGGDARSYHVQANAMAQGLGYINSHLWENGGTQEPTAAHPPAYTTYLAVWSLVGLDTVDWHRFSGCVLGLVTIVFAALTARRLAGDRAALVTAAFVAFYPAMWINDSMLLSETLAQASVAVFLYGAVRCWEEPNWRWAAVAGTAAGVCALTRVEQLALFAVLVVMFLFRRGWGRRRSFRMIAVSLACGAALIVPWVARNLVIFDRPVYLTSGLGAGLSAASCDQTYSGDKLGYYHDCFQGPWTEVRRDAQGRPFGVDSAGNRVDETYRDIEPRRQAIAYITSHLREYPKVVAARVGRLWGLFRPIQTTRFDINIEARGVWQSWANLGALWLLIPTSSAGLLILWARRRPVLPLLASVLTATLGAALTFGVGRYRSTAEVGLLVAAGVAVATWGDGVRPRWRRDHTASTPMAPNTTQDTSAAIR